MWLEKKKMALISLAVIIFAALNPAPALAALGITSVAPVSIVNDVNRTITVSGTDFQSGAIVSLSVYGNLITTFVSATKLTAVVPASIPVGHYDVTVTNPDLTTTSLLNGLTVEAPLARPQIAVDSSGADTAFIKSLKEFTFNVNFVNVGNLTAMNTQVAFTSADLVPTNKGGVAVLGEVGPGAGATASPTFISSTYLYGKTVVTIDAVVTYYDSAGTAYTDKFTLSVPVSGASSGYENVATATPTGVKSGQLIIPSYGSTVDPLQPGSQFTLTMTVQNAGNEKAQRVTMIVGGGSSGTSGGTPQPGGVSGGSGEFTNFAPVGTSNIQSLGDLGAGEVRQVKQDLIVNVSTNPGAYPMKITFSYLNSLGEVVNDEQVITLLVFSLPNIEANFYRPPDPFFQGQPGALPIQLINLGKRTSVLGNIKVTSKSGAVDGGESLVGAIDAGGYFTLDATFTPDSAGEVELDISIDYVDDFNQPRTIERHLKINVEEAFEEPTPDPSMPENQGEFTPTTDETFLQKTWRFILGVFGLDSAPPTPPVPDSEMPIEEFPIPEPVNPGGGGKG